MADEIKLVTFEGSNVAPVNDALMWDAAIGDSGVIYGCETTLKNASTLHIDAGYGVICGRHFQIFESDIPVTLSSSGDLLGRLYAHMDLSDSSEPITLEIETAASLTPEEQDANINIINGVWDMNLATFAVNALTISNLQNVFSTVAGGGAGLIAGTETGATASQAYVAGQYIIWGGRLWEVIAAIAQGDAFVLGSNLSASSTTVGNELTELNSSLSDIDIRYTSENGAEWSPRGAGTWSPFSSFINRSMLYSAGISPVTLLRKGTYIVTWGNPANLTFSGDGVVVDENYGWFHTGSGAAFGEGLAIITTTKDNVTMTVSGWSTLYGQGLFVLELASGYTVKSKHDVSAATSLGNGTYIVACLGNDSNPTNEAEAIYKHSFGSAQGGGGGAGSFVYGYTQFYAMEVYSSPVTFSIGSSSVCKAFKVK